MKKQQLDHVLRAAGRITGERQFLIIGSQSPHGRYPDLPDDIVRSADLAAIEDPPMDQSRRDAAPTVSQAPRRRAPSAPVCMSGPRDQRQRCRVEAERDAPGEFMEEAPRRPAAVPDVAVPLTQIETDDLGAPGGERYRDTAAAATEMGATANGSWDSPVPVPE